MAKKDKTGDEKTAEQVLEERKQNALQQIEQQEKVAKNRTALDQIKEHAKQYDLQPAVMADVADMLDIKNPFVLSGENIIEPGTNRTPAEWFSEVVKNRPSWFQEGAFPFSINVNDAYMEPQPSEAPDLSLTDTVKEIDSWLQ